MQPLLFEAFKRHSKAKGRISKRVFQEKKARQIFRKTNIFYPLICTRTCTYQGVKNVRFSENLPCFLFLKHSFWDSPFCLLTDEFLYLIVKIMYDKSLIYNKWFFYLKKSNAWCAKYPEFVCLVNSQNSNSVTSSLTSLNTLSYTWDCFFRTLGSIKMKSGGIVVHLMTGISNLVLPLSWKL